jgi:Conserved TM helix
MSDTLTAILKGVLDRLQIQATTYLPSIIGAAIVILIAVVFAVVVRRIFYRIFKGATIDRFLRRTGLAHLLDPTGQLRATRVAAEVAYWSILIIGVLAGLSVFGTDLTAQLLQSFVFLIPRLVIAMLIVLGGAWLSQYLARSMLVWAFNEDLPHPRRFAAGVRVLVLFVAAVVAADQLDFARSVFLTAFVILVGGLALTISLAVGIGASGRVRNYFEESKKRKEKEEKEERSLWTHL